MTVLVTGAAGFIGMHVCSKLLAGGEQVIGVDNLNNYYDPALKLARVESLCRSPNFRFVRIDIGARRDLDSLFESSRPSKVVHLAAQAGVRYSLENPHAYADSNLTGFLNVIENCRHAGVEHLVYASSSSVYGSNTKIPYSEDDRVDCPVSLYAATKKANELMAHAYCHLYGFPATGLRFFTVYGPWGRPDMAYFGFTKAILEGRPINVFNHGQLKRDFTYIDDIVEGVVRVLEKPATPELPGSTAPHRVFNIGNHEPVTVLEFIDTLEAVLDRKSIRNYLPMQPGDVHVTYADNAKLKAWVEFAPRTSLHSGLSRFVSWYQSDYARIQPV